MTRRFTELRSLDFPAMEEQLLAWWKERKIFQQVTTARAGGPAFNFYEGPPTANGAPGIHHVLGRALKDTICRYRSMRGCRVQRRAGWDTHGLPVEIEVERELGLRDRQAIEAYGIEAYNKACRESVLRYKRTWDRLTERIAYWVDLETPYLTMDSHYIESVWWLLKQLHLRGLLYRGHKIQWYSPASGTILSSHEVNLGYREVDDPSVFLRFQLCDEESSMLVWTTTPWTLPANAALAVQAKAPYVEVEQGGARMWLAEERLELLTGDYKLLRRCLGAELVERRYHPPYPPPQSGEAAETRAWRVLCADFVDCAEGTGIVHIAPAFGADDHGLGREHGLPVLLPVDEQGRFKDDFKLAAGRWFKDADPIILRDLKQRGLLYRRAVIRHNYPHDWRRDTPLMNYPMQGWFLRTTALRDRMLELNRAARWFPESIGRGRFGDWLEQNVDWALSRRRYWGTPLPIWQAETEGDKEGGEGGEGKEYYEVIGSIEELRGKCGAQMPRGETPDLHRPWVDRLHWQSPDGRTMRRVPEVLDVWFDSGAMPFAQWHYPFENKEAFRDNFPADFIAEGLDQTRGWFYTLHAVAVAAMDQPAYRRVMVNGLVLDARGEKMSKSKGNTVEPLAIVDKHGADVLRWYMISNSLPWENMRFRTEALGETRRKFYSTLENLYAFLAAYANIDGFHDAGAPPPPEQRGELDRWILSRLHSTLRRVNEAYEQYAATHAARALEQLVEELSNWYLRRSRRRFWSAGRVDAQGGEGRDEGRSAGKDEGGGGDKPAAYHTLSECLHGISLMMAPISPFFSEWLYRELRRGCGLGQAESVHLEDFPGAREELIDKQLEQRMSVARDLVSAVLLLRNHRQIKVRQPLRRILVAPRGEEEKAAIEHMRDLILDELNVREIEYQAADSGALQYRVRPVYQRLGPRLGSLMRSLETALRKLDNAAIRNYLESGRLELKLQGRELTLDAEDLEVKAESTEKDLVAHAGEFLVALDTQLTPELLAAGLARESVHRIQQLRKDMDLGLTDRIRIEYDASGKLGQAIQAHADWIRRETLAAELCPASAPSGQRGQSYRIDEEQLHLAITSLRPSPPCGARRGG